MKPSLDALILRVPLRYFAGQLSYLCPSGAKRGTPALVINSKDGRHARVHDIRD